ncbi:zinc metalloprotease [Actinokineospora sp. UTMC 2448]|uniref:zinc metalloprotease n=1 Tax=Actinokineospora sp. UTMC 2448 TaxID=2268449 RepID=UPI00216477AD|nr:zinc metalloprotease [Actinokineospora sp. UTMC 2448]UVS80853.1 zinc-dependent metalloproteinase lipoprotein, family [Actinokineospora sp. UTMC 2448]
MGRSRTFKAAGVAALSAVALAITPFAPSSALSAAPVLDCLSETPTSAAARGGRPLDHEPMSAADVAAVEKKTKDLLARKRAEGYYVPQGALAAATVPVYVHVMAAANGRGDVTDQQIAQQIAVLNETFAGRESSQAANTGFTFQLAGVDRFYNDRWHRDEQSSTYRAKTRKGGMNALNIWLVEFDYLGIATFPWSGNQRIDGIRVHYDSLPGGGIANYNLGETTTHEAGHWFGLYHTFQGGCTTKNDEVADTPAQSSPTDGCPEGRDSCSLPGVDPIHNYMDYSYDSCYNQFSPGQSQRMSDMWTAYRA